MGCKVIFMQAARLYKGDHLIKKSGWQENDFMTHPVAYSSCCQPGEGPSLGQVRHPLRRPLPLCATHDSRAIAIAHRAHDSRCYRWLCPCQTLALRLYEYLCVSSCLLNFSICDRNYETPGEDPYLSGEFAASWVRAFQVRKTPRWPRSWANSSLS